MNEVKWKSSDVQIVRLLKQHLQDQTGTVCVVGPEAMLECGSAHFYDTQTGVWSASAKYAAHWSVFGESHQREFAMAWLAGRAKAISQIKTGLMFQGLRQLQSEPVVQFVNQCCDGLLDRFSIPSLELYGNIQNMRCVECNLTTYGWPAPVAPNAHTRYCHRCNGLMLPDISMFHWNIKTSALQAAYSLLSRAPTIILIGADLNLHPFAGRYNFRLARMMFVTVTQRGLAIEKDSTKHKISVNELRAMTQSNVESPIAAATLYLSQLANERLNRPGFIRHSEAC